MLRAREAATSDERLTALIGMTGMKFKIAPSPADVWKAMHFHNKICRKASAK